MGVPSLHIKVVCILIRLFSYQSSLLAY